jgi:rhamnose transport system ATP-binding protein
MIMDEPTAALSHHEVEDLLKITRRLSSEGRAVLFITHKFEEIFAVADRYVVFRDGVSVGEGMIADIDRDRLIQLMVGRAIDQLFPKLPTEIGAERLRVERLSRARELADVSFNVRSGEILGIYGLVGAGRTELAQCLFGLSEPDSGSIFVDGQAVSIRSPADAVRHGLAYVPEDRQHEGVILPFSVTANVCLPNLAQLSSNGVCQSERETQLAREWISSLAIKASGPEQSVQDLSGGNQQKVVLAKWLAGNPRVLILDEPTKGIDVGAKSAVHAVTSQFAQRGNAVVMISSELPEILGMSDRILVMRRGRVRALFERADASPERIVQAATDA